MFDVVVEITDCSINMKISALRDPFHQIHNQNCEDSYSTLATKHTTFKGKPLNQFIIYTLNVE